MLDLYCERVSPGLFAEPLNALSNVAFIIAAWAAWILARRSQTVAADIWILIALSIVIGIGSALFHIFATGWARFLAEVPILLFQLWYLWLYLRTMMALTPQSAIASIAGYVAAAYFAREFSSLVNGSLIYAPALIVMLSLGVYHALERRAGRYLLLAAASVFLTSLLFRSIDEAVCPYIPAGTHFLWHMLNGVVLYLSMRALIVSRRRRPSADASQGRL